MKRPNHFWERLYTAFKKANFKSVYNEDMTELYDFMFFVYVICKENREKRVALLGQQTLNKVCNYLTDADLETALLKKTISDEICNAIPSIKHNTYDFNKYSFYEAA